jgi:hypothetical protein
VVEAVVDAVDDGAIGEQGGEAAAARLEQVTGAADVQVALVLAGEAGGGQILRRRRAAHRNRDLVAILRLERAVGIRYEPMERIGAGGVVNNSPRLLRPLLKQRYVRDIDAVEQRMQPRPGIGSGERIPVGIGGQGKAVGHTHAGLTQFGIQLAERGVLAADQRHVLRSQCCEPANTARFSGHRLAPSRGWTFIYA